jgi:hypothetical protein
VDRTEIGRFIIALGAALFLSFVATGLHALYQSGDGKPIVAKYFDVSSPNGNSIATLKEVDNGPGFGQGMLYHELPRHGDRVPDRSSMKLGNPRG